MSSPPESAVISAIINGMKNAETECEKATGTYLLGMPEYYITVSIYQSLFKELGEEYLELEKPIKYIYEEISEEIDKSQERVDLVIWTKAGGKVSAAIEVKSKVQDSNLCEDVKKLIRAFEISKKRDKRLDYALSISTIYQKREKEIDIEKTKNGMKNTVKDKEFQITQLLNKQNGLYEVELIDCPFFKAINKIYDTKPVTNERWIWQPVIFKIKRK